MTSQLLPREAWKVDLALDDEGRPTGALIVGAWVRDNVREFVKVDAPTGAVVRPAGVISYAKVGGPPADWNSLKVFDLDTGLEVKAVVEVDTAAGWVVAHVLDVEGKTCLADDLSSVAKIRWYGRFEIRRVEAA